MKTIFLSKKNKVVDVETYLILLGKRITNIREQKNITQYRLAKDLFMEQSNLARIEEGKTNPTVKTLVKICDALDINLENLFAGIDLPKHETKK